MWPSWCSLTLVVSFLDFLDWRYLLCSVWIIPSCQVWVLPILDNWGRFYNFIVLLLLLLIPGFCFLLFAHWSICGILQLNAGDLATVYFGSCSQCRMCNSTPRILYWYHTGVSVFLSFCIWCEFSMTCLLSGTCFLILFFTSVFFTLVFLTVASFVISIWLVWLSVFWWLVVFGVEIVFYVGN